MSTVRERFERARRRRRLLNLTAFAGFFVATAAIGLLVYDEYVGPVPILRADDAVGPTPDTIPTDAALVEREAPRSLTIEDLELWGPVRAVGIEDDGQLEVPDETEIGWYQYGSAPGLPGATVMAAHVSWNRTVGPFYRLATLEPGALVEVELADGSHRAYQVVERVMYPKDALPRERIWRTTGDETLVLITCGGSYNPDIRRYRDNIVVYAVPIAAEDLDAVMTGQI